LVKRKSGCHDSLTIYGNTATFHKLQPSRANFQDYSINWNIKPFKERLFYITDQKNGIYYFGMGYAYIIIYGTLILKLKIFNIFIIY